jgi:hypothetical protein
VSLYKIVEKSLLAYLARRVLNTNEVALVLGRTIHLSGADKNKFLSDKKWVAHELAHIQQYKKYGTLKFLFLYLIESIKHGYYNNSFEIEARAQEETA